MNSIRVSLRFACLGFTRRKDMSDFAKLVYGRLNQRSANVLWGTSAKLPTSLLNFHTVELDEF